MPALPTTACVARATFLAARRGAWIIPKYMARGQQERVAA
jgi:hypothetical protein